MKCKTIYAVYKGDKFIDLGTKDYLAKVLNVKTTTIEYLCSKAYLKKLEKRVNSNNAMIAIKVEED